LYIEPCKVSWYLGDHHVLFFICPSHGEIFKVWVRGGSCPSLLMSNLCYVQTKESHIHKALTTSGLFFLQLTDHLKSTGRPVFYKDGSCFTWPPQITHDQITAPVGCVKCLTSSRIMKNNWIVKVGNISIIIN
jgi:hypothetical protein